MRSISSGGVGRESAGGWNERVRVYRQMGYLRHQLKKEDFRNNKVDAAEISAAESGNAMYVVQVDEEEKARWEW